MVYRSRLSLVLTTQSSMLWASPASAQQSATPAQIARASSTTKRSLGIVFALEV